MDKRHLDVLAKSMPDGTSLYHHLYDVGQTARIFAKHLNFNSDTAQKGGIFHDIGKASTLQQEVFDVDYVDNINREVFRHEICSLFFLSCFDKSIWNDLIDYVSGHHKSVVDDAKLRGLIDLVDIYGFDYVFERHATNFEQWSEMALDILESLGIERVVLTREMAKDNLLYAYNYLCAAIENNSISKLRGVLIGSDHFASALRYSTMRQLNRLFKIPNIDFYHNRVSDEKLYPLAFKTIDSIKPHTIIIAPTGSGKTDCVMKRTRGRIMYTLPQTVSINSMYQRLKNNLSADNEDLDIRVLHSTSRIVVDNGNITEKVMQSKIGASIKVTTPHQLLEIVFGVQGYEATVCDLIGCDIILDEIHTYSDKIQASVVKMIELLNMLDCRIHICTATISSKLKDKIISILGEDNIEIITLTKEETNTYDRHIIHKHDIRTKNNTLDDKLIEIVTNTVKKNEKVLIVKNQVAHSQIVYNQIAPMFPDIPVILIHSRFKRGARIELERKLTELNYDRDSACIVIATQVVEVSLDISLHVLITDCATIDALIQRLGRINRIRNASTLGLLMHAYIIKPPTSDYEANPYSLRYLNKTYDVLRDGQVLRECDLQKYIDYVYDDVEFTSIDAESILVNGKIVIPKLTHHARSCLYKQFDISSAVLITNCDVDAYIEANFEEKLKFEIPVQFYTIGKLNLKQLPTGAFIIPDNFYDEKLGLIL
jgi:CRISPR-associated endonuclease/helicase Cas3